MKIRLNDIELTLPTGQRLTELLAVQEIPPSGGSGGPQRRRAAPWPLGRDPSQ